MAVVDPPASVMKMTQSIGDEAKWENYVWTSKNLKACETLIKILTHKLFEDVTDPSRWENCGKIFSWGHKKGSPCLAPFWRVLKSSTKRQNSKISLWKQGLILIYPFWHLSSFLDDFWQKCNQSVIIETISTGLNVLFMRHSWNGSRNP